MGPIDRLALLGSATLKLTSVDIEAYTRTHDRPVLSAKTSILGEHSKMKKVSEHRCLESFWAFEFRLFRESIGSLHLIAVPARQILTSTLVSALLLFAHGAWSTETLLSTLWESCKGDLAKYCSNVQPKRGGVLTCIYAHDSMISTECGMALNEATLQFEQGVKIWAPVLSACEADYESHCPTTKAGSGRILRCLSKKIHKMGGVSRGCYLALEKAGFL
jgi:hypothetical protein